MDLAQTGRMERTGMINIFDTVLVVLLAERFQIDSFVVRVYLLRERLLEGIAGPETTALFTDISIAVLSA